MPVRTQAELLRIAQEALANARRHADATVVRIQVAFQDGRIRMSVVDNGRGFDRTEVGPNSFGLAAMRAIKARPAGKATVLIALTATVMADDRQVALDNGADDYLAKPFRTGELIARIKSSLRRSKKAINKSTLAAGDITIEFESRTVLLKGSPIKLTSTEYNLLALLAKNEGKVLTHSYILKEVWGASYTTETQYLRVFIAQLRKKVETNPNQPKHILTESGIGYRFVGESTF